MQNKEGTKKSATVWVWVVLHVMLAVYALSSVFSKMAGNESFLSFRFCLFYGLVLLLLGLYAIGWQQIIKRMPLTKAYANKAVSVVWASIYGVIFFRETITPGKVIGGILTISGVVLFAFSDKQTDEETPAEETSEPAQTLEEPVKSTTSVKNKITGDTNQNSDSAGTKEGI